MKRLERINIDKRLLNTKARKEKAQICAERLLDIMRSDLFKDKILSMNRDYWMQGEIGIKDLSNIEIYQLVMSGKEEWNNETDYEIDLVVDDYTKRWSSVIGYMLPGRKEIYVNSKFFDSMTKKKVCSNFAHEYFHTLGARHSGKFFRLSVAYYINTVIEEIYEVKWPGESGRVDLGKYCTRKWYRLFRKKCYVIRK